MYYITQWNHLPLSEYISKLCIELSESGQWLLFFKLEILYTKVIMTLQVSLAFWMHFMANSNFYFFFLKSSVFKSQYFNYIQLMFLHNQYILLHALVKSTLYALHTDFHNILNLHALK